MTREDGGLPHTCLEPRMLGDRAGREDLGCWVGNVGSGAGKETGRSTGARGDGEDRRGEALRCQL